MRGDFDEDEFDDDDCCPNCHGDGWVERRILPVMVEAVSESPPSGDGAGWGNSGPGAPHAPGPLPPQEDPFPTNKDRTMFFATPLVNSVANLRIEGELDSDEVELLEGWLKSVQAIVRKRVAQNEERKLEAFQAGLARARVASSKEGGLNGQENEEGQGET